MRVGALVQARMSSSRLPGKVLRELDGRPALAYLLDRLELAEGLDAVAVATSDDASDDPVAAFCAERGVACARGALDDVLARFAEAAERLELDGAVRVNGDSPFLDQELVSTGVGLFREGAVDLVTNVSPRSFPIGESVEVIAAEALAAANREATAPGDREHVTPFFYRDPGRFRIRNFAAGEDHAGESLALDTAEDATRLEAIIAGMERPHTDYSWREVLALRDALVGASGRLK